ncbi:MAG: hypothetical protein M0Z82_15750 [Actinomycetota bacterium]|jgi:hypothetical protein|nr:hypothetical protein [Actinomycetota bacterium]
MSLLLLIVAIVVLTVGVRAVRSYLGTGPDEARSVDRYGQALRTLRELPERAAADSRRGGGAFGGSGARSIPLMDEEAYGRWAQRRATGADGAQRAAVGLRDGADPHLGGARVSTKIAHDPLQGLAELSTGIGLSPASEVAQIIGLDEKPGRREPGVEANARLTGTTGLVLMVLLFLEGCTIPFIVQLVSLHILIGLILVPPLAVKMASVLWRFSRYYLHDPRYRRAGPPHPLLRAIGPLLFGSTVVLFASGIILWLTGPSNYLMFRIHQLTFFFWFMVIVVHVASHLLRASRLAAADAGAAKGGRGVEPRLRHQARRRRGLIGASLVVGLVVGLAGRSVSTPWTDGHIGPSSTPAAVSTSRHHHIAVGHEAPSSTGTTGHSQPAA